MKLEENLDIPAMLPPSVVIESALYHESVRTVSLSVYKNIIIAVCLKRLYPNMSEQVEKLENIFI